MVTFDSQELRLLIHDLRSPLVSIEGFAQLLLEGGSGISVAEREHAARRIVANVATMTTLLDQLRDRALRE